MLSFKESYVGRLREKVGNMRVILPGSTIIVENEKGEILTTKKKNDDTVYFVGGLVEDDESLYQCAVRECKEETGLDIKNLIPVGYFDRPENVITLENGHECFFHSMLFYCKDFEGELHIPEDEEDIVSTKWQKIEDVESSFDEEGGMFWKAYKKFKETGEFIYHTSK